METENKKSKPTYRSGINDCIKIVLEEIIKERKNSNKIIYLTELAIKFNKLKKV